MSVPLATTFGGVAIGKSLDYDLADVTHDRMIVLLYRSYTASNHLRLFFDLMGTYIYI